MPIAYAIYDRSGSVISDRDDIQLHTRGSVYVSGGLAADGYPEGLSTVRRLTVGGGAEVSGLSVPITFITTSGGVVTNGLTPIIAYYNIISKSGSEASGYSLVTYVKIHPTTFGLGDVFYYLQKAKIGILEQAVVKKYDVSKRLLTNGQFKYVYVDSLNELWNQDDLVSHSAAIELAVEYYESQLALLEEVESKLLEEEEESL